MKIAREQRSPTPRLRLAAVALAGAFVVLTLAVASAESRVVASGTFEGRSDHIVTGGVSVVKSESGYLVVFESDFSLDGAPDPKLAFGADGYDASTLFSKLESDQGAQVYALSGSIDLARYNELWVWCEKFDVPLGVARLEHRASDE